MKAVKMKNKKMFKINLKFKKINLLLINNFYKEME